MKPFMAQPFLLLLFLASALMPSCDSNPSSPSGGQFSEGPGGAGGSGAPVSTFAGQLNPGHNNATGTSASFSSPQAVAFDGTGNLYVADTNNNMIREILPSGAVTTLAGQLTSGGTNATGTSASFSAPRGVVYDSFTGNLFVADTANQMIREINPATASVTTLAGSGSVGHADAVGTAASFDAPYGVASDGLGNLYVGDTTNQLIREISLSTAAVTTLAGSQGVTGANNAMGTSATFNVPQGVACDPTGSYLYVADQNNNMIRKITIATGAVTTFAGQLNPGDNNAAGTSASFRGPSGVAVDSNGNVYVADSGNNLIREITPAGMVSTLAGSGQQGSNNARATAASFYYPQEVALNSSGDVFVADEGNNLIREIFP
ncbi:MAG TPA: NHL repeat-containing protein [bacterium]|jgi:DNA-binding beta-propeller fold protein YncE|nr:NHL repeat-containing protein [bacterium]